MGRNSNRWLYLPPKESKSTREGTLQRSSKLWGLSEQKTPPTPTRDDFTQASPRMTLRSPARPGRCHRHRQGGRLSLGNFPEIPVYLSPSNPPPKDPDKGTRDSEVSFSVPLPLAAVNLRTLKRSLFQPPGEPRLCLSALLRDYPSRQRPGFPPEGPLGSACERGQHPEQGPQPPTSRSSSSSLTSNPSGRHFPQTTDEEAETPR